METTKINEINSFRVGASENGTVKTIYQVKYCQATGANELQTIYEGESLEEAQAAFKKERKNAGRKVNTKGWTDNDQGWKGLCNLELNKYTIDIDEDGEESILDIETIAEDGWFEISW